jgi:hypothetical protein
METAGCSGGADDNSAETDHFDTGYPDAGRRVFGHGYENFFWRILERWSFLFLMKGGTSGSNMHLAWGSDAQ